MYISSAKICNKESTLQTLIPIYYTWKNQKNSKFIKLKYIYEF